MSTTTNTRSWLQRLKEESWEAELLVSTVAIFGTFKSFDLIDSFTNTLINWLPDAYYYVVYFIMFFGYIGLSILNGMFLIHFVLRAYWIGLVGLSSVFPNYSLEDSAYSKIYTNKILAVLPNPKESIEKVDNLCSVIFSVGFTLLFLYVFFSITSTVYTFLFYWLSSYVPTWVLWIPIGIILGMLVLQIFFSAIAHQKQYAGNEKLQNWNLKLVLLTSKVTMGPLYKNFLEVSMLFGSNYKKKKGMIGLVLLYVLFGIIICVIRIQDTPLLYLINTEKYFVSQRVQPFYYQENNVDSGLLLQPELSKLLQDKSTMSVFIPVFAHQRKVYREVCDSKDKTTNTNEKRNYVDCYKQHYTIFLDNTKVAIDYLIEEHARTNQLGMRVFIPLDRVSRGLHQLKIQKKGENPRDWEIPFYLEK